MSQADAARRASPLAPGNRAPDFELPATPIRSAGYTDVIYSEEKNTGQDRIFSYRRP